MRRLAATLLLLASCAPVPRAAAPVPPTAPSPQAPSLGAAEAATVMIVSYGALGLVSGTGLVVRRPGYVLTTAHVIERARRLEVVTGDGRRFDAEVLRQPTQYRNAAGLGGPEVDLALLRAEALDLEPYAGPFAPAAPGTDLVAFGYVPPWFVWCDAPFAKRGRLAGERRKPYGPALLVTDLDIEAGYSGGPVLDARSGALVGLLHSRLDGRLFGGASQGFVIPATQTRSLLAAIPAKP